MTFKQLHQGIIRFGFTGGCRSSGGRWLVSRNYRQITLLSVPGKVLLVRFKPQLLKNRRPQQSGFTLDLVYIDLKAAFDPVDLAALWKSLEGRDQSPSRPPGLRLRPVLQQHITCARRGRVLPSHLDHIKGAPGLCACPRPRLPCNRLAYVQSEVWWRARDMHGPEHF